MDITELLNEIITEIKYGLEDSENGDSSPSDQAEAKNSAAKSSMSFEDKRLRKWFDEFAEIVNNSNKDDKSTETKSETSKKTVPDTDKETAQTLESRHLTPGCLVRHFKGNTYRIDGTATDTETGKTVVIYSTIKSPFKIFVRPEDMFCSKVDRDKYPDAGQKYRFQRVGDSGSAYDPENINNKTDGKSTYLGKITVKSSKDIAEEKSDKAHYSRIHVVKIIIE